MGSGMQSFASDNASAFNPDADRQKKLRSLSQSQLSDLSNFSNEGDTGEDLQKEPLNGGNLSKSIQVPQDAGEPSALSTERVQRAPAFQEASPLLPTEERAGNLLTGEEGRYGPLTEGDRSVSLKNLFGSVPKPDFGQNADAFSPQDPGTAFRDVQQAKTAYGYANTADQAAGGNVRGAAMDYLGELYKQLFPGSRGEVGGSSLSDAIRSGAGSTGEGAAGAAYPAADAAYTALHYGNTAADLSSDLPFGASVNADSMTPLVDSGASLADTAGTTGGTAASTAADTGASTAVGTSVGAATGIVGLYSLMEGLYRMLGAGGEGPTSNNQWADLGFSLIPAVGDVLKEATKGAWTPSEAWRTYGQRLASTLGNENHSLKNLLYAAQNAKTRGDLTQAANMFQHDIAGEGSNPGEGYIGGYTLGDNATNGAPQIGGLPGAGGSKHEYGITANFDQPVGATNRLLQALYDQLPEGAASPLDQHAFDWSMTQPEYGAYQGDIEQALNDPNLSGYRPDQYSIYLDQNPQANLRPELQQLFRNAMTAENTRRYQAAQPAPDHY